MELNPNHPVTQTVHDHWYKIAAILMLKFGVTAVEITQHDLSRLNSDTAIAADCRGGKFVVRLMSMEEGKRLARKEGGLPV